MFYFLPAEKQLREEALGLISRHTFFTSSYIFATLYGNGISQLHSADIIDDEGIEDALKKAVLEKARVEYAAVEKGFNPHTQVDAEILAYGIKNGAFNMFERVWMKIPGHKTVDDYCKISIEPGSNLLAKLRKRILNPLTLHGYSTKGDHGDVDHPVCNSC